MQRERTRVCVIGGAGFIGTHVTRQLANAGRDILVLGRRTKGIERVWQAVLGGYKK